MKQTIILTILLLSTLAIAGERYHPADTNQNKVIEQSEFEDYNQAWRSDTPWPSTGESVPTNYLTRAGHLLLNGGAYQDSGGDMPMCWIPEQNKPDAEFTNSIGMTFVYIEPGTFTMGSPTSEPGRYDDETQHQVTLTKGFYMQTTEVTQGQWKAVMEDNPSIFGSCGDNCPVEEVSWDDVQEFITTLNQKEKTDQYRLPTEAEWEYAARAGTTTTYSFGNDSSQLSKYGNFCDSKCTYSHKDDSQSDQYPNTAPVKSYSPNAWGLYDIHGNVWEWCQDWYDADYPSGSLTDPVGPGSGSYRVFRGGCWNNRARYCRSAERARGTSGYRNFDVGARLAFFGPVQQVTKDKHNKASKK